MGLTETLREERIRHLPLSEAIVVFEDTPVPQLIKKMEESRRGCVFVEKDGKLRGLVSERDILVRYIGDRLPETTTARDIMSSSVRTLDPEDRLDKAVKVMVEGGYRHVPLVDENQKILGLIRAIDVVDYVVEHYPAEVFNLPPRPEQTMALPEGA